MRSGRGDRKEKFVSYTQDQYKARIAAHVAAYFQPEVVSIADDAHIFHFERDERWQDANILFVNRNGHQFRVVRESSGFYTFVKHWEGKPDFWHWEDWQETGLKRKNPEELIRLCGVGPQGRNASRELLTLLPKGTTQRRKAAWRGTILDIRFDQADNKFTLFAPTAGNKSATFSGAPWQSHEAADWCKANLSDSFVPTAMKPEVKAKDDNLMMELEGSDMWGMF